MRAATLVGLLLLPLSAVSLHAGDPVPDVDVTVEQVPGAGFHLDVPSGGPFTEVRLSLPQKIAKNLSPGTLPAGWTLSRDGKSLVLQGPAVEPPVRLRLALAGDDRPREVTYEVRRDGTSLVRRENVVPRPVSQRQIRNSLQGVVQLPSEVAPGEPVAFQTLPKADLPAGGRFTLSGVVAEPFTQEEWNGIPHTLVSALRSRAQSLREPREPIEIAGPPGACAELAAMAAAVAASKGGGDPQGKPDKAWAVAGVGNALKTRHDTVKNAIGNLKLYAAAPVGTGEGGGISIKEEGIEISIKEKGIWRAAPSGTPPGSGSSLTWGLAEGGLPLDAPETRLVALRAEPTATGCRFEPRAPGWAETARAIVNTTRSNIRKDMPPLPPANPSSLSGTVYVAETPPDLVPGALLSLQYLDRYGDLWLDVPAVPDTRVLPPPERAEAAAPCIRAATRHAQLGDLVCVCGIFPTPSAWSGLLIGDRPAGTPASASSTIVWLNLPEGTPLGRNAVSGRSDLGFARACTAPLDVVLIRGEIDSQRLLRGEATPMRLRVDGTADSLAVRIRNLTPSIIQIEGGVEQVTESSGGPENQITRSVRGLTRGNFNVEWSLAKSSCPCAESPPASGRP